MEISDGEIFYLKCQCGNTTPYYSKHGYYIAKNNNTPCYSCRGVKPKKRHRDVTNTEWFRNCPKCMKVLYYSSKRNLSRAIHSGSTCHKCRPKLTIKQIKKLSKTLSNKKYPNRKSNTKIGKIEKYFKKCPRCNKKMGYVSGIGFERSIRQNFVCNSCSNFIYKKSWNYVIKDNHIKKMAATKAGYGSFNKYMKDLDAKKKYYREVRNVTKKQPIHLLENYDKLRGLCGVQDAYQLDHIISIDRGFKEGISPIIIGNISNLRIIPWQDNLTKSNKQIML